MRAKEVAILAGSIIIGFILVSFLVLPVFSKKDYDESLETSTNKKLESVEGVVFDYENDTVSWENQYARLSVTPITSHGLLQQTQFADITWKYPDNNIDIAFRFDDQLIGDKNVWLWQNISHNVEVPLREMVTRNYTIYNITSYSPTSEPETVHFGDIPSDNYMIGTGSYYYVEHWDEPGVWLNDTYTIGYDSFDWLNPEHTEAKFYYEVEEQTGWTTEEQYYFDWNNKNHLFDYKTRAGKHYYIVKNVPMVQNKTYQVKWSYPTKIGDTGKWELMAKRSSDTIEEALSSGLYCMIDPWWSASWSYMRTLTIDSDQVPSDLTGFPILVNISDAIGDLCDGGNSIRFVNSDKNGGGNTTEFYYEIDEWTDGIPREVWVNIPHLDGDEDTVFCMYYGNAGASDNETPASVWDSNYKAVYHMNGPASTIWDSTSGGLGDAAKDTSTIPLETGAGVIGDAQDYEAADKPKAESAEPDDQSFTYELWYKPETMSGIEHSLLQVREYDAGSVACTEFHLDGNNYIRFDVTNIDSTTGSQAVTDWSHIVGVHSDENYLRVFLNGSVDSNDGSVSGTANYNGDQNFRIGCSIRGVHPYDDKNPADGIIDEVRYSDIARSDDWIKTTYNSINNASSTFITFGDQQTAPADINIEVDETQKFDDGTDTDTYTWGHTVGEGNNTVLIVTGGSELGGYSHIDSITFNGDSLTKAINDTYYTPTAAVFAEIWYINDPDVGDHEIIVTWSASMSRFIGGSISVHNLSQDGPVDTNMSTVASSTSIKTNINLTGINSFIIDCVAVGDDSSMTNGYDDTLYNNVSENTVQVATSYETENNTGPFGQTWTFNEAENRADHVIAVWEGNDTVAAEPPAEERTWTDNNWMFMSASASSEWEDDNWMFMSASASSEWTDSHWMFMSASNTSNWNDNNWFFMSASASSEWTDSHWMFMSASAGSEWEDEFWMFMSASNSSSWQDNNWFFMSASNTSSWVDNNWFFMSASNTPAWGDRLYMHFSASNNSNWNDNNWFFMSASNTSSWKDELWMFMSASASSEWEDSFWMFMSASNTSNWNDNNWFSMSASNGSKGWRDNNWFFMSASNSSTTVTIEVPYPSDTEINVPLQPLSYATINHTGGGMMNVTWYYGTTKASINTSYGTSESITSGTHFKEFYPANSRTTEYFWRVCVDAGDFWQNDTFEFRTEGYSGGGGGSGDNMTAFALAAAALLFVFYLWVIRRRRN